MTKTLEYTEMDLAERRSVEQVVNRYRASGESRASLVRGLILLGYDRDGVDRYVDLVESTLDRGTYHVRQGRSPSWPDASGRWYEGGPTPFYRRF